MAEYGKILATIRKAKGIKQIELAENLGIKQSYLSDIERNRFNPSMDVFLRIVRALDITDVNFLLGKEVESVKNCEFCCNDKATDKVTLKSDKSSFNVCKTCANMFNNTINRDLSQCNFDVGCR